MPTRQAPAIAPIVIDEPEPAVIDHGPDDYVRIDLKAGDEWELMHNSRVFRAIPGKQVFVPFAAICLWFGDPRASEEIRPVLDGHGGRSYVPDRLTEVRRLRMRYGIKHSDERGFNPDAKTGAHAPDIQVFTLDGDRIYTVLDDPRGNRAARLESTSQSTQASMAQQIAMMKRQIANMELQQGLVQGVKQDTGVELANDTDPDVPDAIPGSAIPTDD